MEIGLFLVRDRPEMDLSYARGSVARMILTTAQGTAALWVPPVATVGQVAAELQWSAAKVSRLETGPRRTAAV